MRRPGDNEPEPPGGRAAERLREFLRQHMDESDAKKQEIEHGIDTAEGSCEGSTDPDKTDKSS